MNHPPNIPPGSTEKAFQFDTAVCELVRQAQGGSDEAYTKLFEQFRPLLASSVARFFDSTQQEQIDLAEEAERILYSAISTYDCDQESVNFGLYAKSCLRNGLVSEWRRMTLRRRIVPASETDSDLIPDAASDPAGRLMEEEGFRALCRTIRAHLSDFENRVWWSYVTGVRVAEIARELHCDERKVHNALYRIRRKLRETIMPGG